MEAILDDADALQLFSQDAFMLQLYSKWELFIS